MPRLPAKEEDERCLHYVVSARLLREISFALAEARASVLTESRTAAEKQQTVARLSAMRERVESISAPEVPESNAVTRKSWEEFSDTGFLVWINRILHTFGWAIVNERCDNTGRVVAAWPARVKYRGFEEEIEAQCFERVSAYMAKNARELINETRSK